MRSGRATEGSGEPVTVLSSRDDDHWLYHTLGYVLTTNVLGIAGFLRRYPSPDDLRLFMNEFRADGADPTYSVVQINGDAHYPNSPDPEGNQNVRYSAAITYPTPLILYSTDGTFIDWIQVEYLLLQPTIPRTITFSYGFPEYALPDGLAHSVCQLFAYLGVLGASVLVASGGDCKDTSGNVRLFPTFPSTCT
jgi:tripeptidyl-peptidase-1